MKNPFPWGDKKAVEMGQPLYFMSPVFSRSLEEHPDYYFWTVSEGRYRGTDSVEELNLTETMPPHKLYLPEKQRWQVLNYLWSMGKEWEKVHIY